MVRGLFYLIHGIDLAIMQHLFLQILLIFSVTVTSKTLSMSFHACSNSAFIGDLVADSFLGGIYRLSTLASSNAVEVIGNQRI